MIRGTVTFTVQGITPDTLFPAAGRPLGIYNAGPDVVWLATAHNRPGLGIPLPPDTMMQWDADKPCVGVMETPPATATLHVTDNSGVPT